MGGRGQGGTRPPFESDFTAQRAGGKHRIVDKQKLTQAIDFLDTYQIRLLHEMAEALRVPIVVDVAADSDIVTEEFGKYFENILKVHHSLHEEKFNKKSFEYAFKAACMAAGRKAAINKDATDPGFDVEVDGVRFSLKTEAAQGISEERITISKLMEARWIHECRSREDFARESRQRIGKHLHHYARIITLRAFDVPGGKVKYSMIEIPLDLLKKITALTASDFGEPTPQGGSSATVEDKGQKAFTLRLDGSDQKVTIAGLRVDLCIRHADWILPVKVSP
jgi:hypothetical protein